jgi:hypothetical protein
MTIGKQRRQAPTAFTATPANREVTNLSPIALIGRGLTIIGRTSRLLLQIVNFYIEAARTELVIHPPTERSTP